MDKHNSREKVRVSVCVIVTRNSQILLGKRANKSSGEGSWCLPGGHLEFGESVTEAAERELKEETGILAEKIEFANVINDPDCDEFHYVNFTFLVTDSEGEAKVMEEDKCSEWKWFYADELPEPIFSHHREVIEMTNKKEIFKDGV